MALSANTIFEVRTGGSDTNGGGFVEGATGTDWSQQDTAQYAVTDGVTNGTTTITSATASFGTDVVGNIMYVAGGTGGVAGGWYQITVRVSATQVTVDRSTGLTAGTGVTLNIGGALASLGRAGNVGMVNGNSVYIKAGTYTVTSATTNIPGGCFTSSLAIVVEGYQTTRGDMGTPPLLQASGISTFTMVSITNDGGAFVRNIRVDCAGLTSSRGFLLRAMGFWLVAENCTNNGFTFSGAPAPLIFCRATGCSTLPAFQGLDCYGCVAESNTVSGFSSTSNTVFARCVSINNSGASSDGFVQTDTNNTYVNCVAYGNGRDGFRAAVRQQNYINCISEANGGAGFLVNNIAAVFLRNCAVYNNTGGNFSLGTGKAVYNLDSVTGTGSFFTNAAGGDFSLNNTAGAGADARAGGTPGLMPGSVGTGYLDIGALQHQDSGGSCDYPDEGDVRGGVSYDSGGLTGSLSLPAQGDVRSGVGYGDGGSEFTGTLQSGGVAGGLRVSGSTIRIP